MAERREGDRTSLRARRGARSVVSQRQRPPENETGSAISQVFESRQCQNEVRGSADEACGGCFEHFSRRLLARKCGSLSGPDWLWLLEPPISRQFVDVYGGNAPGRRSQTVGLRAARSAYCGAFSIA